MATQGSDLTEIAKSYFAGRDQISHQNVILDSVIGEGVWFGGYSGTANVLLSRKHIKYEISKDNCGAASEPNVLQLEKKPDGSTLIDTGVDHFGAVVGNNSAVGASVIILPDREIFPKTVIQAGTVVRKNTASDIADDNTNHNPTRLNDYSRNFASG